MPEAEPTGYLRSRGEDDVSAGRRGGGAETGYLRSRGEDIKGEAGGIDPYGVPPLARRGLSARVPVQGHPRGTSARAERTTTRRTATSSGTGYLRSRGEDCTGSSARGCRDGVPPLARRGPLHDPLVNRLGRGTSARAERTGGPPYCGPPVAGYLRSRGEDSEAARYVKSGAGVPPLARRGPGVVGGQGRAERGTSARAERTSRRPCRTAPPAGYLRSRGEDEALARKGRRVIGVPPLARRGPLGVHLRPLRRRGTSARAERTTPSRGTRIRSTGYLRSRGEDPS
ncbi:hypothetical protein B591_30618 (plasmid) [Streptomyces sp. GBA 94-10 4N24]|nr:hypothetical protein B591_30618 [Streptomyces sp. GBA 94-10 4N24]UZN63105.1 hypothetical protein B591N_30618 [Streptomyces sp. GBA 94-10 4N24]